MPIRVEAYTAGGVATGVVARTGPLREALDGAGDLLVERSRWLPLDGSAERPGGDVRLAVDDVLLIVSDEAEGGPVHAQWHSIELDTGPYLVGARCRRCPASIRAAPCSADRRVRLPARRPDPVDRP